MFRNRVIPVLLLKGTGLYKTRKFKNPVYLGDAVNICKIFSEKQADELVLLDIEASKKGKGPNLEVIQRVADEAFVPFSYGGGIRNADDAVKVVQAGAEKVVIGSLFHYGDIEGLVKELGSQSVVVSMDFIKTVWFGYLERNKQMSFKAGLLAIEKYARKAELCGAGEILVQDATRDGTLQGYDLDLVSKVSNCVNIPVTVCGGARNLEDMRKARDAGASGLAASSMFVFQGPHRAVMISYPTRKELEDVFC